jgi:hypothetical chaperone protein
MTCNIACGIDFGTSNSTIAVATAAGCNLIALENSKTTLPSALFFQKDFSGPLFGRAAIAAYRGGEDGRLMRGLKKILGTSLMDEKTLIGRRSVPFAEILEIFIAHIKSRAEAQAGQTIDHAVLGRPVHFHDDDPKADEMAQTMLAHIAGKAGFKSVEFLFEPVAAAFAHEQNFEEEKLSLIIDLGGGTSDFSIIRLSRERAGRADRRDDILSSSGVRIGGTNFDARIAMRDVMPELGLGSKYTDIFDRNKTHIMPSGVYFQLSDWALVNFAQTPKAVSETKDILRRSLAPEKLGRLLRLQEHHLGHALLEDIETAKIALSQNDPVMAECAGLGFTVPLSRALFEEAIRVDLDRISGSIDDCLKKAGLAAKAIDLVVMTGGSTELPVINEMVVRRFPQAVISQENKLDSVGLGLAWRARHVFLNGGRER